MKKGVQKVPLKLMVQVDRGLIPEPAITVGKEVSAADLIDTAKQLVNIAMQMQLGKTGDLYNFTYYWPWVDISQDVPPRFVW
jgi:hypothetical protein